MRHIIECAVSLGFLLDFAQTVPEGYTTLDVVQKIVIPATNKERCRYVVLSSVDERSVGRSQYFISHRWAANFVHELVVLVASHFADSADLFTVDELGRVTTGHLAVNSDSQSLLTGVASARPENDGASATTRVPADSPAASAAGTSHEKERPPGHLGPASPGQFHSHNQPPLPDTNTSTAMSASSRENSCSRLRRPHSTTSPPLPRPPHGPHAAGCMGVSHPTPLLTARRTSSRLRAGRNPGSESTGGPDASRSRQALLQALLPGAADGAEPCDALPQCASGASLTGFGSGGRGTEPSGCGGSLGHSFSSSLNPLHARPSFPEDGQQQAAHRPPGASGGGGAARSFSSTRSGRISRRTSLNVSGGGGAGAGGGVGAGGSFSCRAGGLAAIPPSALVTPISTATGMAPVSAGREQRDRGHDTRSQAAAATARATAATSSSGVSEPSDAATGDFVAAASASSSGTSRSSWRLPAGRGVGLGGWIGGAGGGGGSSGRATNAEVVGRLCRRFVGRERLLQDTFVWLDIFAINQHPNTTQADDLSKLQEVVGASNATLLVCDPGGQVLTRIWCLYEIWQTVQRKAPKALQVLAGSLDTSELDRVWGDLDVEKAQATVEADRVRILADIRATTGANELNRHIKRALVESASLDLETARATCPGSPAHAERAYRAAVLLRTHGSHPAALVAAREAAEVFASCRGPAHEETLEALRLVASCHKSLGDPRLALELLEQQVLPCLAGPHPPGHPVYDALSDVGMLQYTLGQYDQAYGVLLAALSQQLRRLLAAAPPHPAKQDITAALAAGPLAAATPQAAAGHPAPFSGEQLGTLLAALQAGVAVVRAALKAGSGPAASSSGSPAAPETRSSSDSSSGGAGDVGGSKAPGSGGGGSSGAAASSGAGGWLAREVMVAGERVGLTLHCLGLVQKERATRRPSTESGSLLREARELMAASVELLEVFGGDYRGMGALDARSNLASLMMDGGDLPAAEQLLRANLALTESVYGGDHPHTATALNNLAICLKRRRARDPDVVSEVEALYRRCLAVCRASLGEAHLETLVVATNLGVLLADQRQWSESERLLTGAVANLDPQVLGPGHPDVLAAHRRLAEVLELRNKLFESEALYRMTLQLAEAVPVESRDHGLVLECKEGLARVQEQLEAVAKGQGGGGCCVIS